MRPPLAATVSVAVVLAVLCTTKLPAAVLAFEQDPWLMGPVRLAVGAVISVTEAVAVPVLLQPPSLWVAVRLALKPGVQPSPGRSHVSNTSDPDTTAQASQGRAHM